MSIVDVFKNSFIENFTSTEITTTYVVVTLFVTFLMGAYIFFCYRIKTRNAFYSKEFSVSLVVLALITAAIILTIQQSIVVSLGMVGALSIVRFRTAIKNPMDLIFLFWSIAVGIICGAGLTEAALLVSLVVTGTIVIFETVPVIKKPMVLTLNYRNSETTDKTVYDLIDQYCGKYEVKARSIVNDETSLVAEIRIRERDKMTRELANINGVTSVSVISYDGDSVF